MVVKINLKIADKIITALRRREELDGAPFCPCKPQSKSTSDICPCLNFRTSGECCCNLFVQEEAPIPTYN